MWKVFFEFVLIFQNIAKVLKWARERIITLADTWIESQHKINQTNLLTKVLKKNSIGYLQSCERKVRGKLVWFSSQSSSSQSTANRIANDQSEEISNGVKFQQLKVIKNYISRSLSPHLHTQQTSTTLSSFVRRCIGMLEKSSSTVRSTEEKSHIFARMGK